MNQQVSARPGRGEISRAPTAETPRQTKAERDALGLKLTEPLPLSGMLSVWRLAALVATLMMGVIAVVGGLYFGRSILLPVVAGIIVGITFSPAVKAAERWKVPPALSAVGMVLLLAGAVAAALTFFAAPLSEWIARAPEIGGVVHEKLRVLDYPMSVFRNIKSAIMPAAAQGPTVAIESNPAEIAGQMLGVITPALSEFVVFVGTLIFFLSTNSQLRQKLVVAFVTRDARLRTLRIWNDIEDNLVSYVGMVTVINLGLGVVTGVTLYLIGFPNPVTFGLLTMVLNYVPYLGAAMMAVILFGVGVVAMPSLAQAALAPALFVVIATVEGQFVTPSVMGRHLTLSPFVVFLSLAFWTWLWGPVGAFLAVPMVIVSFVILGHLLPRDDSTLPG